MKRVILILLLVTVGCCLTQTLSYANIADADAYIFSITCGNSNTDINQHSEGHWEYFRHPTSTGPVTTLDVGNSKR